jgi:hypothetical protein
MFRYGLISLLPVIASGCGSGPYEPGTKVYSVAFGLLDESLEVREVTRQIEHRVGNQYGWQLTVTSTGGTVRV